MLTTKTHRTLAAAAAALLAAGVALAGNPFSGVSTTVNGYSTWDADLINADTVPQTGKGVYVAVLDTGLVPNWKEYFPEARIATRLGTGFEQPISLQSEDGCLAAVDVGQLRQSTWVGSTASTHGTLVTSTIIGYFYKNIRDTAAGFPLPPIIVRGIAPDVTIIPVKVLADYQLPALPHCSEFGPSPAQTVNFGTEQMLAAGINYATDLAITGYRPMIITMSLGGFDLVPIKDAIDRAIANSVIVVAAAGNEGTDGMHYPGAYPPVISAGSAGWTKEWLNPTGPTPPRYLLWWLQSPFYAFIDIPEPTPADQVYVSDFSSRELAGQQLDVLAPGSWVRGPFPDGYGHLPWWSSSFADLRAHKNLRNFFFVGGTSMATPHVTSVAALMLEKNPHLNQAQVEAILKVTALPIAPGSATVFDVSPAEDYHVRSWEADATGAGLVQAYTALSAVP